MGAIFRGRKCYTGKVKFTDYQNIGKIDAFMRTTAPEGYLACDGSTYNIADYPLLCDVFASDFGSVNYFGGNGTTTFAVPDLRGEFLRGTGTNGHSGQGAGSNVGVHQNGTYLSGFVSGGSSSDIYVCGVGNTKLSDNFDSQELQQHEGKVTRTGSGPSGRYSGGKVRPTNTSVLYCIRAY